MWNRERGGSHSNDAASNLLARSGQEKDAIRYVLFQWSKLTHKGATKPWSTKETAYFEVRFSATKMLEFLDEVKWQEYNSEPISYYCIHNTVSHNYISYLDMAYSEWPVIRDSCFISAIHQ